MSDINRKMCVEFPGTMYESMQENPVKFIESYKDIFTQKMTPITPSAEYGEEYSKLVLSMVEYEAEKRPLASEVLTILKKIKSE
jgi:hypothetical protein